MCAKIGKILLCGKEATMNGKHRQSYGMFPTEGVKYFVQVSFVVDFDKIFVTTIL